MDSIYDREEFPTLQQAIDWVWASSSDEVEAVGFVLSKFFVLEDGIYTQNRIAEEIEEYTAICESNAINGKKGGRPKGAKNKPKETQSVLIETQSLNLKSEINQGVSESKPNHKPLTTNHIIDQKKEFVEKAWTYFWDKYPKRVDKKKARSKFELMLKNKSIEISGALINKIGFNIDRRLDTGDWLRDESHFIPSPAKYLLNELWNDEI
jgi:uncharacterized protein YdaU (DUF1376 family)